MRMARTRACRYDPAMVWFYLVLAIICEAGWAIAMKLSDGLTRWKPTVVMSVLYVLSVVFLAIVTKRLNNVGVVYAIWAGSGVALIAIVGFIYFKEPVSTLKVISLGLIVVGIIGVQVTGSGH